MGSYHERLLVPVSYWLLAVPSIAFLGAEAWFVAGGIVPPITLAVLCLIAAAFLVYWGAATIEVTGGVLRAGRDTLPLGEAGEVARARRGAGGAAARAAGRPGGPSLPPALRQAGRLRRPRPPGRRRALLADLDQAPGPADRRDRPGRRRRRAGR